MNKLNNTELDYYTNKYFDKSTEVNKDDFNLSEEYYQISIYLRELKRYRALAEQDELIFKKIYE